MATMHISLPEELKSFVDEQVSDRGYGTNSEYVRDLIHRERLRTMILDGMNSPIAGYADEAYFDGLRQRILDRG